MFNSISRWRFCKKKKKKKGKVQPERQTILFQCTSAHTTQHPLILHLITSAPWTLTNNASTTMSGFLTWCRSLFFSNQSLLCLYIRKPDYESKSQTTNRTEDEPNKKKVTFVGCNVMTNQGNIFLLTKKADLYSGQADGVRVTATWRFPLWTCPEKTSYKDLIDDIKMPLAYITKLKKHNVRLGWGLWCTVQPRHRVSSSRDAIFWVTVEWSKTSIFNWMQPSCLRHSWMTTTNIVR